MRFKKFHAKLMEAPFYNPENPPMKYIFFLKAVLFQEPDLQLLKFPFDQAPPSEQNELVLYFHFFHFINPATIRINVWRQQHEMPLFKTLNNSLRVVLNPELIELKMTPYLTGDADSAEIWKRIIELEPAATTLQLEYAIASCRAASAEDHNNDDHLSCAANLAKAIEYAEEKIALIRSVGENPTEDDYHNIAVDYWDLGETMKDPLIKAEYFAKAAKNTKEGIKIAIVPQDRTPTDYDFMAHNWMYSVEHTLDPLLRDKRLAKATKYAEKYLAGLAAKWGRISGPYVQRAAELYFNCGKKATDPLARAAYLTKAIEYSEIILRGPSRDDYLIMKVHDLIAMARAHLVMGGVQEVPFCKKGDDPSLAG